MKFLQTRISGKFLADLFRYGTEKVRIVEGIQGEMHLVHTGYITESNTLQFIWRADDDPRAVEVPEGAMLPEVPVVHVVFERVPPCKCQDD